MKTKTSILAVLAAAIGAGPALANSISLDLARDWNFRTPATNIGPLATSSANWESTLTPDTGDPVTGTIADMTDDTGAGTAADASWASSGTYWNSDGTSDNQHILSCLFMGDGGTGLTITVTDIPYAKYKVYGLFASDYAVTMQDFQVNGTWVVGGASADNTRTVYGTIEANNTANGEYWTEISGSATGNYWTISGLTSSTLTIQGQPRDGSARGSLTGVIIEEITGLSWDPADDDNGGAGDWNTTGLSWQPVPGTTPNVAWAPNDGTQAANFEGTGGAVTLTEAIAAGEMNITAPGYTFTGSTLSTKRINTPEDATISSALTGTAPLLKTGGGTLSLTGDGSGFTDTLTVAFGRINLTNTLGGSVTVEDGTTLGGEPTITGDLQLGSTGGTGATLAVDVDTDPGVLGTDNLTLEGMTNLAFEGTLVFDSPIPIASHSGTLTDNSGGTTLDDAFTTTPSYRKTVVDNAPTIEITLGTPQTSTWDNASGSGFWSFGSALNDDNWTSTDSSFYGGDSVTFDDTAPGSVGLDDSEAPLKPASTTFANTTGNDYTLTGSPITGTGSLTVNGTGTVTLTQNHNFTGGTTVNDGRLVLAETNNGAAGVLVGTVTVNSPGILEVSETNAMGWGLGTKVDTLNLNGSELVLSQSSDSSWGVTVNLSDGATISNDAGTEYMSLGGGTKVNVTGDTQSTISARLQMREAASGTVFDVADGAAPVDLLVSGEVWKNYGFNKTGEGTMLLTGANTYTGDTTVSAGCLSMNDIGAVPDLTKVTVAPGAGFGGIVGASNLLGADIADIIANVVWDAGGDARLVIDTNGANVTLSTDIVGNFKLLKKGAGTLTLTGTVTVNGIIEDEGDVVLAGGSIDIHNITTGPGTNSGRKVTIEFTAPGNVDVYTSEDLETWGSPIAIDVPTSPFIDDDVPDSKLFYILVPAGETFP